MPAKFYLYSGIMALSLNAFSQFSDDFSDGTFLMDPEWQGDTEAFETFDEQLRSNNDPDAGGLNAYYLSTASTVAFNATWEFEVDLQFNTSGVNYVDFFLMSDASDLKVAENGYFIRIGDTSDEIVLYKISGGMVSPMIDENEGITDAAGSSLRIRVTRSLEDLWSLEIDNGKTGSFDLSGTIVDSDITISGYCGILIEQSSANAAVNGHYFDNISVNGSVYPDVIAPSVDTVFAESETQVAVIFSEDIEPVSAENVNNYSIPGISVNSAVQEVGDNRQVNLMTSGLISGQSYQLILSGIEDLYENTMDDTTVTFEYLDFSEVGFRDVVINEFLSDPIPSIGLPEYDFIELYNPTDYFFNIGGWTISDEAGTSDEIPSFVLRPDAYVMLCDPGAVGSYESYGDVIGVSGFPNLNTTGDSIILRNNAQIVIDKIGYDDPPSDGVSSEQINPHKSCSDFSNFLPSNSQSGGSPGLQNTVFDGSPDITGPEIQSIEILAPDSISISFDESLDEGSIVTAVISISGIQSIATTIINPAIIHLKLQEALQSEVDYELSVSGITDCEGNPILNGDYDFRYDISGPRILETYILRRNEIALVFNEELVESVAENENNYEITENEIKSGSGAQRQDSATHRVHLQLINPLEKDRSYSITVSNMRDSLGNEAARNEVFFTYDSQIDSVIVLASNVLEVIFKGTPNERSLDSDKFSVLNFTNPIKVVRDESDPSILRFELSQNLRENRVYELYGEGIVDEKGNWMSTPAKEFIWDTRGPEVETITNISSNSLDVHFNERIKTLPAVHVKNYQLSTFGNPFEVILLSDKSVRLFLNFDLPVEEKIELSIRNIEDLYGNSAIRKVDFVYDLIPPRVDSVFYHGGNVIRIFASESLDYGSLNGKNFKLDGEDASDLKIYGPDSIMLDVTFPEVRQSLNVGLQVNSWKDRLGNELLNPIEMEINTLNPRISEIVLIDSMQLELTYSKQLPEDVMSHYFQLNQAPVTGESPYQLKLEENFETDEIHHLTAKGIYSTNGIGLAPEEYYFQITDYFDKYQLLDDVTLELMFTTEFETIDLMSFEYDPGIAFVSIDPESPGTLRFIFSKPISPNQYYQLKTRDLFDRWNRRLADNTISFINDTNPPYIHSIESRHFSTIRVLFNEEIDAETVLGSNQYQIGQVQPIAIHLSSAKEIDLQFDTLMTGQSYDLVVKNIGDLSGNYLELDTVRFNYEPPVIPLNRQIIISEIMADPDPSQGLPEIEYIELFNASEQEFSLSSMVLGDPSGVFQLPDFYLGPDQYIALSDGSEIIEYEGITIDKFPSLSNESDSLYLAGIYGSEIDVVDYDISWYGNSEKEVGGFSLEIINPFNPCSSGSNWKASANENGGTPGGINSVYDLARDTIPPQIVTYTISAENILNIEFDEMVILGEIFRVSSETLEIVSIESARNNLFIEFRNIPVDEIQSLLLEGIYDCSGNEIGEDYFEFGIGRAPAFNEIIFTEIMSDPEPSNGLPATEYLEILNRTDDLLSLEGLYLKDATDISQSLGGIISPNEYLVLYPNGDEHFPDGIRVGGWTNLSNSGERISLMMGSTAINSVNYSDEMHKDDSDRDGGISLEILDIDQPCLTVGNWASSRDPSGGSPGENNSWDLSIEDRFAPQLKNVFVPRPDSIQLIFNEGIHQPFGGHIAIAPIMPIDSIVIDFENPEILNLVLSDSLTPDLVYKLAIEGVEDCGGNSSQLFEVDFSVPTFPNHGLIISEILFNPLPNGYDFVEIHNLSDKYFSLPQLSLENDKGKVNLDIKKAIEPAEYLAFTIDKQSLKDLFPGSPGRQHIEMTELPAMNDDEGWLKLVNANGVTIDSIYYLDDFHSKLLKDKEGVSLERFDYNAGTSNWVSSSSLNNFGTPGYKNSQSRMEIQPTKIISANPRIFIPGSGNPGDASQTTIEFEFQHENLIGSVSIMDLDGKMVRRLSQNASFPSRGFFMWDGTDSNGKVVRVGHYIILFQVFNDQGYEATFRETVVVATRF